jgi:hypothetical protein
VRVLKEITSYLTLLGLLGFYTANAVGVTLSAESSGYDQADHGAFQIHEGTIIYEIFDFVSEESESRDFDDHSEDTRVNSHANRRLMFCSLTTWGRSTAFLPHPEKFILFHCLKLDC